jgi:fumarate reductase flavoprotein subunit
MAIIRDRLPAFTSSVPVIVIGAGAAGALAALAARDAGAKVLVLDRDASPTGATALSSGMIPAAGTPAQEAREVADTPEQFSSDIQAKSNGRSAAHLVEAYTRESARTLQWIERTCGVSFELVEGVPPGHALARMHALADRGGTPLLSALYRALAAGGVRVQPAARVTDLYVDADERVLGVRYQRGERDVVDIGCSAVVVATNGFAGNTELVAQHLPDVRALPFAGHDSSQGDALVWGNELGAAIEDIDGFLAHSSVVMPQRLQLPWALMTEGAVQVNRDGERFGNEHEGYSESALFVLAQPEGIAFNIYDERIHEVGLAMPNYLEAVTKGLIKRAATLRDLADTLGVDRNGLEQTVALVNALAFEDDMDDFGRSFHASQMILGPYYGVQVTGALLGTEGGLAIDADGRVLRPDGTTLPNLLAAGGAARGLSGDGGGGYLEGNGLLAAVVGGYLAGRKAAELAY